LEWLVLSRSPDPASSGQVLIDSLPEQVGDGSPCHAEACRRALSWRSINCTCVRLSHHNSFNPNWICRDVVEVDVITPAVGEGVAVAEVKTTAFGVPKLARLKILKNSARNCALTFSVIAVFLATDKSVVARPGPTRTFRPVLP
jgi:hypothetical protein